MITAENVPMNSHEDTVQHDNMRHTHVVLSLACNNDVANHDSTIITNGAVCNRISHLAPPPSSPPRDSDTLMEEDVTVHPCMLGTRHDHQDTRSHVLGKRLSSSPFCEIVANDDDDNRVKRRRIDHICPISQNGIPLVEDDLLCHRDKAMMEQETCDPSLQQIQPQIQIGHPDTSQTTTCRYTGNDKLTPQQVTWFCSLKRALCCSCRSMVHRVVAETAGCCHLDNHEHQQHHHHHHHRYPQQQHLYEEACHVVVDSQNKNVSTSATTSCHDESAGYQIGEEKKDAHSNMSCCNDVSSSSFQSRHSLLPQPSFHDLLSLLHVQRQQQQHQVSYCHACRCLIQRRIEQVRTCHGAWMRYKPFVCALLQWDTHALAWAHVSLKIDLDVIGQALERNPTLLRNDTHYGVCHRNSMIMTYALHKDGMLLQYIPPERRPRYMIEIALQQEPMVIGLIQECYYSQGDLYRSWFLRAFERDPRVARYAPQDLLRDESWAREAVQADVGNISWIHHSIVRKHPEWIMEAIKRGHPSAILLATAVYHDGIHHRRNHVDMTTIGSNRDNDAAYATTTVADKDKNDDNTMEPMIQLYPDMIQQALDIDLYTFHAVAGYVNDWRQMQSIFQRDGILFHGLGTFWSGIMATYRWCKSSVMSLSMRELQHHWSLFVKGEQQHQQNVYESLSHGARNLKGQHAVGAYGTMDNTIANNNNDNPRSVTLALWTMRHHACLPVQDDAHVPPHVNRDHPLMQRFLRWALFDVSVCTDWTRHTLSRHSFDASDYVFVPHLFLRAGSAMTRTTASLPRRWDNTDIIQQHDIPSGGEPYEKNDDIIWFKRASKNHHFEAAVRFQLYQCIRTWCITAIRSQHAVDAWYVASFASPMYRHSTDAQHLRGDVSSYESIGDSGDHGIAVHTDGSGGTTGCANGDGHWPHGLPNDAWRRRFVLWRHIPLCMGPSAAIQFQDCTKPAITLSHRDDLPSLLRSPGHSDEPCGDRDVVDPNSGGAEEHFPSTNARNCITNDGAWMYHHVHHHHVMRRHMRLSHYGLWNRIMRYRQLASPLLTLIEDFDKCLYGDARDWPLWDAALEQDPRIVACIPNSMFEQYGQDRQFWILLERHAKKLALWRRCDLYRCHSIMAPYEQAWPLQQSPPTIFSSSSAGASGGNNGGNHGMTQQQQQQPTPSQYSHDHRQQQQPLYAYLRYQEMRHASWHVQWQIRFLIDGAHVPRHMLQMKRFHDVRFE